MSAAVDVTVDVTTVADDLIVVHAGGRAVRRDGLLPATEYTVEATTATTLDRPEGELLCRFATVNDVHFGELECGRIDEAEGGPVVRVAPGEPPYPETMNRAAVAEMAAAELAAVVVKGDLSADGRPAEWAAFEDCYRSAFGKRLHVVRGNHDAYRGQDSYAGDQWIELPGIAIALLDTVIPERTTGTITGHQLDWLEENLAEADRPVIVLGHHQQWTEGKRSADYFGLDPDASDALDALAVRRPAVTAYAAGHTHRHRVRTMKASGVPTIEVGCVKDFPGTWAEYRVHEGGVMQVVHRISAPQALAWSERCRHLYADFGMDYQTYALGALTDRCFTIPVRARTQRGSDA